jgi:hypothetical protein
MPLVGWLNPVLYTFSSEFVTDISAGSNACSGIQCAKGKCAFKCCASPVGYRTSSGWDPVTGLVLYLVLPHSPYHNLPPPSSLLPFPPP